MRARNQDNQTNNDRDMKVKINMSDLLPGAPSHPYVRFDVDFVRRDGRPGRTGFCVLRCRFRDVTDQFLHDTAARKVAERE